MVPSMPPWNLKYAGPAVAVEHQCQVSSMLLRFSLAPSECFRIPRFSKFLPPSTRTRSPAGREARSAMPHVPQAAGRLPSKMLNFIFKPTRACRSKLFRGQQPFQSRYGCDAFWQQSPGASHRRMSISCSSASDSLLQGDP